MKEKLKTQKALDAKKKWNNEDLAQVIARRTGLTPNCARLVMDSLTDVMCEKLKAGGEVHLSGIGKFFVRIWKGRDIVLCGTKVHVPERLKFSFKPYSDISNDIRRNSEGHDYERVKVLDADKDYANMSQEQLDEINATRKEQRLKKIEKVRDLRAKLHLLHGLSAQLPQGHPLRMEAEFHVRDTRFCLEGKISKFENKWVESTNALIQKLNESLKQ